MECPADVLLYIHDLEVPTGSPTRCYLLPFKLEQDPWGKFGRPFTHGKNYYCQLAKSSRMDSKNSISSTSSTHSARSMIMPMPTAPSSPEDHSPTGARHSYSCKRCRRLKKKCSRTKPGCANCMKAGELCEYVPRAPRRKKSEILKSLGHDGDEPVSPKMASPMTVAHQHQHQHQPPHQQQPHHQSLQFLTRESQMHHTIQQQVPLHQQPHPHQQQIFHDMRPFQPGSKTSLPPLSSLTGMYQQPYYEQAYQHSQQQSQPQSQPQRQPTQRRQQNQQPHPRSAQSPGLASQQSKLSANELHQAYLSKVFNLANESKLLTQSNVRLNVSPETLDKCIKQFFESFMRLFPFINRTALMAKFEPVPKKFQQAIACDDHESFELIMVVLIGYTVLLNSNQISQDLQLDTVLQAKSKRLFEQAVHVESVETVHKMLYFSILALLDQDGHNSWFIDGVMTRLALGLGMNRTSNEPYSVEVEWKNRIFWSVYVYDRSIASAMGRMFALDDENIDVAMPQLQPDDDPDNLELNKAFIELKKLEGRVIKNVHSLKASQGFTEDEKMNVLKTLRMEIEGWYNNTSLLAYSDKKLVMNPAATAWYTSSYYHLLLLLYKPSFLVPKLSAETLQLLGKSAVQHATYVYNLHTTYSLPLVWPEIAKFLSHCSTMVFCVCLPCVDLTETKTELKLCLEILDHFRERCAAAGEMADLFRRVYKSVCDSQVGADDSLAEPERWGMFLRSIGTDYLGILKKHQIDIVYDEPVTRAIKKE